MVICAGHWRRQWFARGAWRMVPCCRVRRFPGRFRDQGRKLASGREGRHGGGGEVLGDGEAGPGGRERGPGGRGGGGGAGRDRGAVRGAGGLGGGRGPVPG